MTQKHHKRITLREVAAHTGLSVAAVSDIVNRGLAHKYTEQTQDRVQTAIRELRYLPSRAAQDLKRGRTDAVGVLLTRRFHNPYYARLLDLLRQSLAHHELESHLVILDRPREKTFREAGQGLIARGVEALIIGPVFCLDQPIIEQVSHWGPAPVPLATFGSLDHDLGLHNVLLGGVNAGALATRYLVDRGHRRIALMMMSRSSAKQETCRSFEVGVINAMERLSLLDDEWIESGRDLGRYDLVYETAFAFAHRWVRADRERRPTAVIFKNDQMAIAGLAAFHQCGIRVPEDLSVLGYDNVPESAYTIPALTTVDTNLYGQMMRLAHDVAVMLDRVTPEHSIPMIDESHIIERKSVRSLTGDE